ncbi:Bifunctional transcriptional activator/DNA repair enzyme AdaA [Methylobrevis pamukkalensis]|uniref:Bifunctional transcriptional activator/DNA repair enzyme AdaA n=1 Tax=Methylobrevis pamukkalensis TaxID=1439726 RepID=A0A1E3H643_9HYPH|nr:Bifunctional transcriptional activator/DNA repair enzyme AdaA [Methylobrevis pamukkalensis]
MGLHKKIAPDFEVIVCAPSESFRWNVHDYPHHLAKWHYHPEFELHLIQSSSGKMMIGDYIGDFAAGTLVLTGPDLPHNWVSEVPRGTLVPNRDMLIQFGDEFARKVVELSPELEELEDLFRDAVLGIEFTGATAEFGRRLLREIGEAHGADRLLLFLRLMTGLARDRRDRRLLSRRAAAPVGPRHGSEKLEIAMGHILENFTGEISLTQVAKLCRMEPSAFSRFFKKQTGHTFARYVNRTRVYAACNLLTHTERPVTEICFEVGYNNIANFNRQFAQVCGVSPSLYRREARRVAAARRPRLRVNPRGSERSSSSPRSLDASAAAPDGSAADAVPGGAWIAGRAGRKGNQAAKGRPLPAGVETEQAVGGTGAQQAGQQHDDADAGDEPLPRSEPGDERQPGQRREEGDRKQDQSCHDANQPIE